MNILRSRWLRREMENYQGLLNGCAPGTHENIVRTILDTVPHRSGVLDLGAGSGALLARLRDAGFEDLHAADLAAGNFGLSDIPYTQIDLNRSFASKYKRKFKVVCLSEVLEHLDSPRDVVRQARNLLEEDGYLIITEPNVAFWEGRLKFLLTGELWGFGEKNYRSIRHISPMTDVQLRLTLQEIGFHVVKSGTAGSFATPLRRMLLAPAWLPIIAVAGKTALGECVVVVAKKAPPDDELAKPTIYDSVWTDAGKVGCSDTPDEVFGQHSISPGLLAIGDDEVIQ